jgi:hypothetical protein
MLRDIIDEIIEAAGPFLVKALAALAGLALFLPLLVAFVAPMFG